MPEPKAPNAQSILTCISTAQKSFSNYDLLCKQVDDLYSAKVVIGSTSLNLSDNEYDLFWSSMEILKPAIYAKPPQVVSKPRFSDASTVDKAAADVIERVVNSEFERSDIDQVMLNIRDDLALCNRGVAWLSYESTDGKKVCTEHLDRDDFLHEPARKWSEVGWVARRAWLTRKEMAKRFRASSGNAYQDADYRLRKDSRDNGENDGTLKAGVWEVWHKADNRVYWVTDGVEEFLDEDKPHLKLSGFFPCPRPAYGTLRRRTLIPVPDWVRYEPHLEQINRATVKIYDLLEQVKLRGLIPAGGDVGTAIETAMAENDSTMFIPVPSAAMMANGGQFVQFLPLIEIAGAITGLIEARNQMFNDFYQLSGISDIMRGATEAQETLGAQRLKSQYGSIRVREKIDEMVRVARDCARIAVEIISENFDKATLLEIAQVSFPTTAEIERAIKDVKASAKSELEQLGDEAEQMAQSGEEIDPEQAQQQLMEAQQAIIGKYQPELQRLQNAVVVEAVMKVIKDDRARSLAIDIETDSTVLVDEMAEKQSRTEFLSAFASAQGAVTPLMQAGEAGAKLAGGMLKFALQPYNANRELDSLIDDFIDAAPEMAAAMAEGGTDDALIEAQNKLAEAEMMKAQAAMAGVQAKAQLDQAEMQRKMAEMQQKAHDAQMKGMDAQEKLRLQLNAEQAKTALIEAQINKLTADTAKILSSIGLDERRQELTEYQAAENSHNQQIDREIQVQNRDRDDEFRERGESRADMQFEQGGVE